MRSPLTFVLALASCAAGVLAQQDPNSEGPFALVAKSRSKRYNGLNLGGIHIGAAINLGVLGGTDPQKSIPLYLNHTYAQPPYGQLHWNVRLPDLVYSGGLSYNTSSNLAQFWLSVVQPLYSFSFSPKNELLLNDQSRWFVCNVSTPYGIKEGVTWKLGSARPEDPKCEPIQLFRVDHKNGTESE